MLKNKSITRNNSGFAHLAVLLIPLVLISIVGAISYYVITRSSETDPIGSILSEVDDDLLKGLDYEVVLDSAYVHSPDYLNPDKKEVYATRVYKINGESDRSQVTFYKNLLNSEYYVSFPNPGYSLDLFIERIEDTMGLSGESSQTIVAKSAYYPNQPFELTNSRKLYTSFATSEAIATPGDLASLKDYSFISPESVSSLEERLKNDEMLLSISIHNPEKSGLIKGSLLEAAEEDYENRQVKKLNNQFEVKLNSLFGKLEEFYNNYGYYPSAAQLSSRSGLESTLRGVEPLVADYLIGNPEATYQAIPENCSDTDCQHYIISDTRLPARENNYIGVELVNEQNIWYIAEGLETDEYDYYVRFSLN